MDAQTFIPLSVLNLQTRLAPRSTYATPQPEMLARSIVEGKRELDKVTQNELSEVSNANRLAPPASARAEGEYVIARDAPLPLPAALSHRWVSEVHLWIGVEEGTAIVLDGPEHELFSSLRGGHSPADVVAGLDPSAPSEARWDRVNALIGRLACAGFIRGIEGYTDHWEPRPGRFMPLHLTRLCNLSCVHCYADSSPHAGTDGELPPERWLRLIDDFADEGGERVLFTGGEALVYPGCDRLLRRSRQRGLDVTLFSNGILVDRYLDVIQECVDQVQISIDGPDAETNDPIRGKGSFDRARAAVDTLLDAGVKVRVSMVLMERNLEAMRRKFIPFARRWQGRPLEWRLGYGVTQHGRGSELGDTLQVHDVRPVVEALMAELEGKDGPRIARSTKGCGYAEQIVVAHDGSVHPCHLLDGGITHIDDQPIGELIRALEGVSQEYSVDQTVGCNRCDIRNLCGGSCRILNGKATGNRRVTNCTAIDKLRRLHNLVETFSSSPSSGGALEPDWE